MNLATLSRQRKVAVAELLPSIEQFLRLHGMSAYRFGVLSIQDRNVVYRMRRGLGVLHHNLDAIRRFMETQAPATMVSVQHIINTTAEHYGIERREMMSKSRVVKLSKPRQVAMYLCYIEGRRTLTTIARYFGKDHTTVLHAKLSVHKQIQNDLMVAQAVERISAIAKERTLTNTRIAA